jgi:tRNA A-37 threonylcarbamoyl transferase component Bud32
MAERIKLTFAGDVAPREREAVACALADDLDEAHRYRGYQRSVKEFYRIETPARPLLVKVRPFGPWPKRLSHTVRRTKAEREFRNLLGLRQRGVPCPSPVAVGRIGGTLLIHRSLMATEFLSDARPLSVAMLESADADRERLLDRLVAFFALLRDKGVVHRDLHWNNILVTPGHDGPSLRLIDALHIDFESPPAGEAFAETVRWLVTYMLYQDAPRELVDGLVGRLPALGLASLNDAKDLIARAADLAAKL